jgi:hypothetical protein
MAEKEGSNDFGGILMIWSRKHLVSPLRLSISDPKGFIFSPYIFN